MSERGTLTREGKLFIAAMREKIVMSRGGGKKLSGPLSIASVARACGVAPTNICLYLKGKREPTYWLAVRIAKYLAIDSGELNGGDGVSE